MEYDWANPEKKKSDIKILKKIVKDKGFSDEVINPISEFLAEKIEMMDRYYPPYSVLKKGIKRVINHAGYFTEKNPETALSLYKNAGGNALVLAGRLNDEKLAKQAKEYFSSIVERYKKLIGNLNKEDEDKKWKYKFLSKDYEFLSDNAFRLKEILNVYFKKRESIENLIDSAYKPFFSLSKSEDFVLDKINILSEQLSKNEKINYKELKDLIIGIQEDSKCIELDSGKINQAIKKILVTKLTGQLNRLENLL